MSTQYNPLNERIKKKYFEFQLGARHKSELTLRGIRKAILRFENYTEFKDFCAFNKDQAVSFRKYLSETKAKRTSEPLSKSTLLSTMNGLKEFFIWFSYQPGYESKINIHDIEYFSLSEKEISIAKAGKFKLAPTQDEIKKVIFNMPYDTDIQRRDRAIISLTDLTGLRDGSSVSLRLKHIDLKNNLIIQEPDQVNTKFSKRILTYFFPVGDDIKNIFVNWIKELMEKNYGPNDPVFPRTRNVLDENNCFKAEGLEPKPWTTTTPIREIFKKAFNHVGLPYFNPHSFRNTLVNLGERLCTTPEQFKAWSQNLGHEKVMTTLSSYGNISPNRQGEIIQAFGSSTEKENENALIFKELKKLTALIEKK